MSVYLDTSALAKWYVNEPGSEAFASYVETLKDAVISRLTMVEMRCLLSRHRRMGHFDEKIENRIFMAFQEDIRLGFLRIYPLEDEHAMGAIKLMSSLPEHALRTLDALHLSIALSISDKALATADRVMANAAEFCHLKVMRFGHAKQG